MDSPVPSASPAGSVRQSGANARFGVREIALLYSRRKRFAWSLLVGLVGLCFLYWALAPNQYEATATVSLRTQGMSLMSPELSEQVAAASILSTPMQLETLANELRSDRVAWRVIRSEKLYEKPAFRWRFLKKFPGFDVEHPSLEAESYLLEAFGRALTVRALPRTLLLEVKFRTRDPGLSAEVANAVVAGFQAEENRSRAASTEAAAGWLGEQLKGLTAEAVRDERELAAFERSHGLVSSAEGIGSGAAGPLPKDPEAVQLDELSRAVADATEERIEREALYREAAQGNPEQVLAANPEKQAVMGPGGAAMALQLQQKLSDARVELAQLEAEHGPNYPRVVELQRAVADIQKQIAAADASLTESFKRSWEAAVERERLLRKQFDVRTAQGTDQNETLVTYAVMRARVMAQRTLCEKVQTRIAEAGLTAGVHAPSIVVVDPAHAPFKPVSPNLPVDLAVTVVVGAWLALGGALLLDARERVRVAAVVAMLVMATAVWAQAPIPNTQGLPTGVVHPVTDAPVGAAAPSREGAPVAWSGPGQGQGAAVEARAVTGNGVPMALPIAAGDFLEVTEFHTPEFHSQVRVAAGGTVDLPMVGAVALLGKSEQEAARAIEKALKDGGVLLHPQVTVLVTGAVGQDVSVLGEVTRPGVYAYTVHHRLLDLISAASGLSQTAGRLVNVYRREDSHTAHAVVLDPTGADAGREHNPELEPGDTVVVSRAGLVYVIGDVVRPGGFAVDPVQGLTVVQAVSLAWGATPSAAMSKAVLIHDQPGGRTLTTLNLKRMIRGQDPDLAVHDRDILFLPDSTAKELWKRSLESAIQSAVGVTIYAGLVYSQRF